MLQLIASSDWLSTSASRTPVGVTTHASNLIGPSEEDGGLIAWTADWGSARAARASRLNRVFMSVGAGGRREVPSARSSLPCLSGASPQTDRDATPRDEKPRCAADGQGEELRGVVRVDVRQPVQQRAEQRRPEQQPQRGDPRALADFVGTDERPCRLAVQMPRPGDEDHETGE